MERAEDNLWVLSAKWKMYGRKTVFYDESRCERYCMLQII